MFPFSFYVKTKLMLRMDKLLSICVLVCRRLTYLVRTTNHIYLIYLHLLIVARSVIPLTSSCGQKFPEQIPFQLCQFWQCIRLRGQSVKQAQVSKLYSAMTEAFIPTIFILKRKFANFNRYYGYG